MTIGSKEDNNVRYKRFQIASAPTLATTPDHVLKPFLSITFTAKKRVTFNITQLNRGCFALEI